MTRPTATRIPGPFLQLLLLSSALSASLLAGACGNDDGGNAATPDAALNEADARTTPACTSDEQCTDLATPICHLETGLCGNNDYCLGDDTEAEARSDDTGLGASVVVLGASPVVIAAHICDAGQAAPADERDLYVFHVPSAGTVTVSMAFPETADLDMAIYSSMGGQPVGFSYWQNPEVIALDYLPAGDYYLEVDQAAPVSTASTAYTLTFTRQDAVKCTSTADCATTYAHQIFRAACDLPTGACLPLAGASQVALGGVCDSANDCASSLCLSYPYVAEPDTRSICSQTCTTDDGCASVGAGFTCSTGADRVCMPPCTRDEQCPVDFNHPPPAGADWLHGGCDVATGRCTT